MMPLPEILLKLPPATLDALAAVVGPVPGLAPNAKPFETARALFLHSARFRAPVHVVEDISEMFDPQAAAAVFSILPRIASEAGLSGAIACARAWGDPRAAEWVHWSALDVAAALAMEIATTIDVAEKKETYERAKCLVVAAGRRVDSEPPERPTYELVATSPLALDPKRLEDALRGALGKDLTEVWPAFDAVDGTLQLALFVRRGKVAYPVVGDDGRIEREEYRPVTVDLLRISADGSRVSLTLDEPRLLSVYAKSLRLSLEPSFTLHEIHPSTIDALLARTPAGMRVEIDGLGFAFADGSEHDIDGHDVWSRAEKLWATGTLRTARLQIKDEHGRAFGVSLQTPHRIEIPEMMTYPLARAVLLALGIVSGDGPAATVVHQAKKGGGKARAPSTRRLH